MKYPGSVIVDPVNNDTGTSARSWLAVMTVGMAVFLITTAEMVPTGLLPAIARDLRVTEGQAGLSVTLYGVVAGLLAPIGTVVTGRTDRRALLLTILVVFAAGNALSAAAPNYLAFMFARFASGLTHGLAWSIVAAIAVRLVTSGDAVRATSVVFSGISGALVVGVPFGAFMGSTLGWRWVFASMAVLSAFAVVLVRGLVPPLPAGPGFSARALPALSRSAPLMKVLAVTAAVVVGNYCAYTYLAPFLIDSDGVRASHIGMFLLCYGIAGVAGNFASAALLGRTRAVRPALTGLVAALTVTLLVTVWVRGPWALLLCLILWGASYSALPVVLQTQVLRVSRCDAREAATSLYVLVFNCAIAVGAMAGAFALDHGDSTLPMLIGSLFCAAGVSLSLLISPGATTAPSTRRARP